MTSQEPTTSIFNQYATEEDVNYCYRLLLGREPDMEGWQIYMQELPGLTIFNLMTAFLRSPEFKNTRLAHSLSVATGEPILVNLGSYEQYVLPNDPWISQSIELYKTYEPHVTKSFINHLRSGNVVVDIGANIGYYSLLAAHHIGRKGKVYAFEPNQHNCLIHNLSILRNKIQNIQIYPLAVAKKNTMYTFDILLGSNGVINAEVDSSTNIGLTGIAGKMFVCAVRLDDILINLSRLDLIKIDIEGAEYLAVSGGEKLIRKFRPIIISEYTPSALQSISHIDGVEYLRYIVEQQYTIAILQKSGLIMDCGRDFNRVHQFAVNCRDGHIDIIATPTKSSSLRKFWFGNQSG